MKIRNGGVSREDCNVSRAVDEEVKDSIDLNQATLSCSIVGNGISNMI